MKQIRYVKEISIGILVIGILLIGYFGVLSDSDEGDETADTVLLESLMENPSQMPEEEEKEENEELLHQEGKSQETVTVVVDVKGAVKYPGVFSLNAEQRVIDAVEAAGGLTEEADSKTINFAQLLVDEMYVYIPATGEETTQLSGMSENHLTKETIIDINSADETEMLQLDGIGPSKAAEIIKYRETNGPFKSREELVNVSGIGEKTFERIKEMIKAD
ncbi:competence protein ComEA [Alkalibacterium putridalgicola]|uniref:Competence protein CelA n=1 Tax=Alkalibacterium putridalgicola TaxID=426703 RepID=A0A1H7Q642_9LACT|nr:helix-hairpin-helix domain-containing protein [Alkalibacterium putridalgicola]GEK88021.1 competence protein CelA [Alkalibacterium putridalgicola]SEL43631.1 competence protein ComEA [Alkalibacterium putridalgicola]